MVTCNNQLKVYRLVRIVEDGEEESRNLGEGSASPPGKVQLECRQTFTLFGTIAGIKSVSFPGSVRDSLLLCFPDAKISVVEYDPSIHDLRTTSLHFFEDEEMKQGYTQSSLPPVIRVDPDGRCAALLIYGRSIVILPFRREAGIISVDQDSSISQAVKSPVLSSYRIPLHEEDAFAGDKINNILDIEFLEGYNEPTLLILHEPIRTCSGRLAVRQDTVAMATLSLNIGSKLHPVIWSVKDLPYDCWKAVAVPKPVGGVLIFSANSLIYLNQSVPPYGVSLNGFNEGSTSFPLTPQKGVKISLDASYSCFLSSDKLLVSLRGGELYVLTLFYDGMRSVRKFHFQKAASSVLTSSVTHCDEEYVFLGSRLGNSLLLKYNEKPYEDDDPLLSTIEKRTESEKRTNEESSGETEPAAKAIKTDYTTEDEQPDQDYDIGDWMAKDVKLMSEDDLEVYGESADEVEKLPTVFSFEVCDSIANIAPCGKVCMGEPAFLSEEFFGAGDKDPQVELVTTSGFGKNGALSLVQRTIRPQIIRTVEIPHSTDIWTVFDSTQSSQHHSFMIISRSDSTMVFQTGEEINELDSSGFNSQTPTLLVANVGNKRYIIQVASNFVRLIDGGKLIQNLPLELGSPISLAFACDPYIILLTESGILVHLEFSPESKKLKAPTKPKLQPSKSAILSLCVYKDVSGVFSTEDVAVENVAATSLPVKIEDSLLSKPIETVDDEDELLYGESTVEDVAKYGLSGQSTEKEKEKARTIPIVTRSSATYWLFVGRDNGVLEIYSLPDYKLVYYVKNFYMSYKVILDSGKDSSQTPQTTEKGNFPTLKELLVIGLGVKESRPLLFARFDDQLYVYEAFPFYDNQIKDHLKIRFRKYNDTVILRPIKTGDEEELSRQESFMKDMMEKKRTWLIPFDDVTGYSGVFVCGPCPSWFFVTNRGDLRKHDMTIDGGVISLAAFDNINCSKGFLYFNQHCDLRFALLPTQVSYDASWPMRKIPLRCTVHHLTYHVPSKCYVVVTSVPETFDKLVRVAAEEKDYETLERDENYIWPTVDKFSMELFSPVSWDAIQGTKIDFEEWEHVTCLKNVSLVSEETESGLKGYVALGTNYSYGEDVTNRGRIWIIDIIDVVPEPGMPLTRNRIKTIYCKEQKGPVTALCQVKGYLLSAIGQKIYIWNLKEDDLIGVAFIDTQIYIHSALSIKNLILVADVYKSISLLRYQEETRTLAFVARETRSFEVYGCQFLVDSGQLAFIVSDAEKNLIVYTYSPEMRESFGGTRLVRRADFSLGSNVVSFFRIRTKNLGKEKQTHQYFNRLYHQQQQRAIVPKANENTKHITVYGTLDGSLGFLLPLPEKTYRRLLMVQNVLTTHVQHHAGLNPKAYRMYRTSQRILPAPTSRAILDGDLLFKFGVLSLSEKTEVARKIGTTHVQIIDDLNVIIQSTGHF